MSAVIDYSDYSEACEDNVLRASILDSLTIAEVLSCESFQLVFEEVSSEHVKIIAATLFVNAVKAYCRDTSLAGDDEFSCDSIANYYGELVVENDIAETVVEYYDTVYYISGDDVFNILYNLNYL